MTVSQKKIRVQFDFDEQGFDELEALKTDVRAGSRADTVRYGLGLLRWAVDQLKDGARILVEKDGDLSGVVFPFLPAQQVKAASSRIKLRREGMARETVETIRDEVRKQVREVREQVENWTERGRDPDKKREGQIRSALDAGRQAYREQTGSRGSESRKTEDQAERFQRGHPRYETEGGE